MSNFFENLNITEEYKPSNFEALPKGNYLVVITGGEEKTSKTSNKPYLSLTYEVIEGEYKGRKIFVNLFLFSDNPDAVRIARNEVAGICYATSTSNIKDVSEVTNKPFMVKLGVRKNQEGELVNSIQEYMPATGVIGNAQPVTPKKPWER